LTFAEICRKIRIINNGIEISSQKSDEEGNLDKKILGKIRKFCSNGPVVASIGRLSREKGFSYLIQAVDILIKQPGENCRLMLIGDGRLRNELQQQADQLGFGNNFFITGYIRNARRILHLVDVYIISSLTEGLPITLLETMASHTPVVATAVGGIPHVLRHEKEGLLVPAEDAQAISVAVKKLLHDGALRDRLATHAFARVRSEYSSEKMAEAYHRLYSEVLRQDIG